MNDRYQVYAERQAQRGYVTTDERNIEEFLRNRTQKIKIFFDGLVEEGFDPDAALLLTARLFVE